MANKIDVKAEAERIAGAYLDPHLDFGVDLDGHRNDLREEIEQFASRVRDEATREAVEKACNILDTLCVDRTSAAVPILACGIRAIRQAFAGPGKEQEPRDIGKAAIAYLREMNLPQFVDAAVRLAEAHMEYPASGHPEDMTDTETILHLAPQFKEPKP